ncbi:MAG: preprotein translocase subunit SecG [Bacteroidetes bacterium]|nr:preprotein translocase subunit SecG [Bacteroidota bacterium]MCB0845246.1 preprotein translocase subunit SecG [Bacteroidota bacterium]MCB0853156.1 preprotein translocase subunit SecG [Bacteroidota bacterium]
MFVFLGILAIIVAGLLIVAVVIQNSKGGGLSSTFGGGASQIMGARRSSEFIEKATWYLAAALAIVAFLANVAGTSGNTTTNQLRMSNSIEDQIISNPVSLPEMPTAQPTDEGDGN